MPILAFLGSSSSILRRLVLILDVSRPHCSDQCWNADDVHHPLHIVGKDVQRHLGGDVFQRPHLEVSGPHPRFDGAVWMLNCHGT